MRTDRSSTHPTRETTRYAVRVTPTDERTLSIDELIASWKSGLLTGNALCRRTGALEWTPLKALDEVVERMRDRPRSGSIAPSTLASGGEVSPPLRRPPAPQLEVLTVEDPLTAALATYAAAAVEPPGSTPPRLVLDFDEGSRAEPPPTPLTSIAPLALPREVGPRRAPWAGRVVGAVVAAAALLLVVALVRRGPPERPAAPPPGTPFAEVVPAAEGVPSVEPVVAPASAAESPSRAPRPPATPRALPAPARGSFDPITGMQALNAAAASASECARVGEPSGVGQIVVTFDPRTGSVSQATLRDRFAGTPAGDCVVATFLGARVAPFAGEPVSATVSFTLRPTPTP